jgi:hypothetical protein
MTTDPRVENLRDAQRRLRSALIANADRLDKPFTDDPDKNPWDTFVRPAMRGLESAVDAIAATPAAPVAAPPTGQTDETTAEHHVVDGVKYLCHTADHYCPAEPHRLALSTALGLGTSAPWDAIRERAAELAGQGVAGGDEGDELVCVDECGLCDACGMEPFGTPAEGWREAARFLRRTARASGNREGALHGARLIETELRRLAEDATPVAPSAATPNGTGAVVAASGVREAALREAIARIESPERRTLGLGWESAREVLRQMLHEDDPSRLAAETPGPETQARRGDKFEQWLKAQRDAAADYPEAHQATDGLLDLYRLHADTGTPLGEHVCEGRVVGDCECLETPAAFEADLASKTSPKGDAKAEVIHACPPDGSGLTPCCGRTPFELPLSDRISSEAPITCTAPAVVAEPGKEA